jgi:hypothetical protein
MIETSRVSETHKSLFENRNASPINSTSMTVEQIEKEALTLPSEVRALLADRLVAEVNQLDKLWATEAKRRRAEIRQGRVKIPGDGGLAKVRPIGRQDTNFSNTLQIPRILAAPPGPSNNLSAISQRNDDNLFELR